MTILLNAGIVALTFLLMEGVAWFTHKYVMHGFLWWFHRDHHVRNPARFFEKNDVFFLIFAVPSAGLLLTGTLHGDVRIWIGLGIALYGLCYVLVHDLFIHQRFRWPNRPRNAYLRAIQKAHLLHHKHLGPENGEYFGMLWPTMRLLREVRGQRTKASKG